METLAMVIKEEEEHLNYLDVQKTFKFWRRKEKKGKKKDHQLICISRLPLKHRNKEGKGII